MNDERAATLEPVRKTITVERPLDEAFEIFTTRLSRWWPLGSHSISGERAVGCTMEPEPGGRLYETRDDGAELLWGTMLTWDPPHRVVFTWHPGRDAGSAQQVEVRFTEAGTSTRVDLEHTGWEKLGDQAEETRNGYVSGWEMVFVTCYGQTSRDSG
jgi:uncharacterized protein YndB with AHSA1/START domain